MVMITKYCSKTTRNFNAPMGKAAKFTIAEVCLLRNTNNRAVHVYN